MRRPGRGALKAALKRHPRRLVAASLICATILAGAGLVAISQPTPAATRFTYAGAWTLLELQRHIQAGEVIAVTSAAAGADGAGSPATLIARTTDGQSVPISLAVEPGQAASALQALGFGNLLTQEAALAAASVPGRGDTGGVPTLVGSLLPILLLGAALVFVLRSGRLAGRQSNARFSTLMPTPEQARARTETVTRRNAATAGRRAPSSGRSITLADVAGCDEAKLELSETVQFLKDPDRFQQLGATVPRGILLYGPPGTGKTMLARGVAAEAGVPFHYASGSEFVEKYVGVGARRVRDLFAQARKLGVGVIFFDEFDAIGKARGGANGHEEREQTLNQLLVEMDGFSTADEVIVIAATNRMDILDPALLRPGRFSRKVHVGLPDVVGRRAILDIHARNKPLGTDVDLDAVARKTYGFSGAQLADLLNEGAIIAARSGSTAIGNGDLQQGWLKVAVGTSRRRSMDDRERSIIAAHEVGHAICGRVHGDRSHIEEISLFAHGEALGVTVSSQEDNDLPSESDLRARLVALMGGRAAEELLFHDVTGGASNDFDKANQIATTMVTRYGMARDPDSMEAGISGRGALSFLVAHEGSKLPGDVQAAATRAIRGILDEAYAAACETLVHEMDTLRRIASYLVEHERMDGDTFDQLFTGQLRIAGAELEWRAGTSRPRDWAEIPRFAGARRLAVSGGITMRLPATAPVAATAPVSPVVERAARKPARSEAPRDVRLPVFRRRLRGVAYAAIRRAETWVAPEGSAADRS